MLPVLQTCKVVCLQRIPSGLYIAPLLTLQNCFTVGWPSHFPSHVTPVCDTPRPKKKKVKSYAFSPRVYQEKSLSCGCGGLKTEGNESPPAILGCVLRITVLRVKESKRERAKESCVNDNLATLLHGTLPY